MEQDAQVCQANLSVSGQNVTEEQYYLMPKALRAVIRILKCRRKRIRIRNACLYRDPVLRLCAIYTAVATTTLRYANDSGYLVVTNNRRTLILSNMDSCWSDATSNSLRWFVHVIWSIIMDEHPY